MGERRIVVRFLLSLFFFMALSCHKLMFDTLGGEIISSSNRVIENINGEFLGFTSSGAASLNVVCETPQASLYRLDHLGNRVHPALAQTSISANGKYSFATDNINLVTDGTGANLRDSLVVVVEGCSSGVYMRPVTGTSNQDISAGSSLLGYLMNTDEKAKFATALKNSSQNLDSIIGALSSAGTFAQAYTNLNSNATAQATFTQLFSVAPTVLTTAAPEVIVLDVPSTAQEHTPVSMTVNIAHWSSSYQPVYAWKVDNVALAQTAAVSWTANANQQGVHAVSLTVGENNGSGSIDLAKPVRSFSQNITVANNILPSAPAISIVTPIVSGSIPINVRNITVQISTGVSFTNCESFSTMALTEGSAAAPSAASFVLTCNQDTSQNLNFTVSSAGDGAKTLRLWAKDAAGVISTSSSNFNFNLDTQNPTVQITTVLPVNASSTSQSISFSGSDNGGTIDHYECRLDGASFSTCVSPIVLNGLSETGHNFYVRAIDTAGNISDVAQSGWAVDATAPTISITTPNANNTVIPSGDIGFVNFSGACSEDNRIVTLSSGAFVQSVLCSSGSWSANLNLTAMNEGLLSFQVTQSDGAGNSSSVTRTIIKDTLAPIINLTQPQATRGNGAYGNLSWTLTESNPVSGGTFAVELYNGTSWSALTTKAVSSGVNTNKAYSLTNYTTPALDITNAKLRLSLTDAAGNATVTESNNFIIETTIPTLSSVVLAENHSSIAMSLTSVQVSATASIAPLQSMRFAETNDFSGAIWQTYSADEVTYNLSKAGGVKTVYAQVRSSAGNVSAILSDSVVLESGSPPVLSILSPTVGGVYVSPQTMNIKWSCVAGSVQAPLAAVPITKIQYTTNDGLSYHDIIGNLTNNLTADTGEYNWAVPALTPDGQAITALTPLKVVVFCSSETGVVISSSSDVQNSVWKTLVGEPGNLATGVHIEAADLGSSFPKFYSDSSNTIYYTKGHGINRVDPISGLVSSWLGDLYVDLCNVAQAKFVAPLILDINSNDEMTIYSRYCSSMAKVRISDKSVIWSKILPAIDLVSENGKDAQTDNYSFTRTGYFVYYSDRAIYLYDTNNSSVDPVRVFGTPGLCGTLGASETAAADSPMPCKTTDQYQILARPDLNKIWIRYNAATIELYQSGAFGQYRIGVQNRTDSGWGTNFTRCMSVQEMPTMGYCARFESAGNTIAAIDFTSETWSSNYTITAQYKSMGGSPLHLGASRNSIYIFSAASNELLEVKHQDGVFSQQKIAGAPFFNYGNGTDPTRVAFTAVTGMNYEPISQNLYLRATRSLRILHVDTAASGGARIDNIATAYNGSLGNSGAYGDLVVNVASGAVVYSRAAGAPENIWSSYSLSSINTASETITGGSEFYIATGTASAYPTLGASFPVTGSSTYNLRSNKKIATFLSNNKLYFIGSSDVTDTSDLWIFESYGASIRSIAGANGPVGYNASHSNGPALGAQFSSIYGMQSDNNGDLLIFDGNRLRKVTIQTESGAPKIYDLEDFSSYSNFPSGIKWTHAVHDNATGWSYFAVTADASISRVAQVWAARSGDGFVQISTTGLILPSENLTARSIDLEITPMGLLLLDTSKKRILATPLKN